MMRLEDVTAGAQILGIAGDAPVTVVAVTWIGGTAIMSRAWNWPSEVLLTT
jgi:hypothetical protein